MIQTEVRRLSRGIQRTESAGRPVQGTPAHDVDVKMEDGLTAVLAGVDNRSVAFCQAEFRCNLGNHVQQVAAELSVLCCQLIKRNDWFPWNQQNMHRSLWTDIMESQAEIVFVDDVGRDLTINDLLEDGHEQHFLQDAIKIRHCAPETRSKSSRIFSKLQRQRNDKPGKSELVVKNTRAFRMRRLCQSVGPAFCPLQNTAPSRRGLALRQEKCQPTHRRREELWWKQHSGRACRGGVS